MTVFDWVSTLIGLTATKLTETISSESIKIWLNNRKSNALKNNLLNLYEELVLMEYSSIKFVELLDQFNTFHEDNFPYSRTDKNHENDVISNDLRWMFGWGHILTRQANDVSEHMQAISNIIRQLNPGLEIYLPEISEFMKVYNAYIQGEAVKGLSLLNPREKLENITFGEFKTFAPKIKEAIDGLRSTKKQLAEFIKSEFSLKEL